jgi:hypothetical protein
MATPKISQLILKRIFQYRSTIEFLQEQLEIKEATVFAALKAGASVATGALSAEIKVNERRTTAWKSKAIEFVDETRGDCQGEIWAARVTAATKPSTTEKLVVHGAALVALTIVVFVSSAQITQGIKFKMTESLVVRNTTLPAGNYTVGPVQGNDLSVLEVASASGKPSVMVEVEAVQPGAGQSGTVLLFNKYKNVLALSQVFPGGGAQGYQLSPGHPEKQAAKSEKPTTKTVVGTGK